ncbi:MAG: hypothetical protein WCX65_04280 [bacterium]
MTESARQALAILRDASQFQWYVIPLLTLVTLAYATEVEKKNWNVVFAGLTYFGLDIFIEIVNSLIFHFTQYAPAWGTPGKTAYLLLIGMNIEICFMFALVGLVMSKYLPQDKSVRVFGVSSRLAVGIGAAAICATVEILLNRIGVLTWEYPWWNAGFASIIMVSGYFMFFMTSFWVYDMPTVKKKISFVGSLLAFDVLCIAVFGFALKWI